MSSFLAPIHDDLFRKIQKVNKRASLITTEAMSRWGSEAEEAQWMSWDDCGKPLDPNTRLADVIDLEDIHGWLLQRMTLVECREACFFGYLAEKIGDDIYALGEEVYRKDGLRVGNQEREKHGTDVQPIVLYQCLYHYLLNGMPCDDIDEVLENTKKVFRWKKKIMPQRVSWKRTSADSEKMEKIYLAWIEGFASAFEPEFKTTIEKKSEEMYITFEKAE